MKKRINLYTEEFKPVPEPLPLTAVALLWGAVLVLVLGYGGWLQMHNDNVSAELSALQEQQQQQQVFLDTLQQQLAERRTDPVLEQRLVSWKQEITLKRKLSQRLTGEGIVSHGYSSILSALSRIEEPQLWLTQVTMNQAKMSLHGKSVNSDVVPRWVQRFADYPELAEQGFSSLVIERDEQQQLGFSLSASLSSQEETVQ